MSVVDPSVILRLGSHAEKDYFEKVIRFIDGYIIAANLVEATPAATASLVFRFSGKKRDTPYLLDPMTYAFGAYHDPENGAIRYDLDWIKSDQKRKKETVRDFKRSYKSLGEAFGGPFAKAVSDSQNANAAILPSDLEKASVLADVCKAVVKYQLARIREIYAEEMKEDAGSNQIVNSFPRPLAILAPYFYVEPTNERAWLGVNLSLMRETASIYSDHPVHGVLCVDESVLLDSKKIKAIADDILTTGIKGIWLWISKLNEHELPENGQTDVQETDSYRKLSGLRSIVETLSGTMEVFNMHGGFFSLALSKYGLKGISHGVGYGEQKDVVPVVGQAIPVVRYYLPPSHRRLGVPDIERCFSSLRVEDPDDFYKQICDCAICKGVVSNNVNQFRLFGEMQPPKPGKKKSTQTPAAAKRCRFHFLLRRIRERDWVKTATLKEITEDLRAANQTWSRQRTVQRYCPHLEVWAKVLTS